LKNLEKAFVVRQARRLGLIRVKRYELPDTKEFDKKKDKLRKVNLNRTNRNYE
jgi:hypothetical protein